MRDKCNFAALHTLHYTAFAKPSVLYLLDAILKCRSTVHVAKSAKSDPAALFGEYKESRSCSAANDSTDSGAPGPATGDSCNPGGQTQWIQVFIQGSSHSKHQPPKPKRSPESW